MRLIRENAVAMLIDIQERLLPAVEQGQETLQKAHLLVRGLHVVGVPLVAVRHYPKGLGKLAPVLEEELKDDISFDKITFSAVDTPAIARHLQALHKKQVIVFGMESHVCVLQTVIDLLAADYEVALVADCVASRHREDKTFALHRAEGEGALITTCEAVLFELARKADTEEGRQIIRLVK